MSKKTSDIKFWTTEQVELVLRRLAEEADRKLGPYVEWVIKRHILDIKGPDALEQEETTVRLVPCDSVQKRAPSAFSGEDDERVA